MNFEDETSSSELVPNITDLHALFIDMDDTLVSYREPVRASLNAVRETISELNETDVEQLVKDFMELLSESMPHLINKEISYRDDVRVRMKKILDRHGHNTTEDEIVQLDKLYWKTFWKNRKLLPEAIDLLKLCNNLHIPVAIISNGNPEMQRKTMSRLKLHNYVNIVLTPGNVDEMKPNNTLFDRAMKILGVNPEKIIMVGNSFSRDVIGAVNAGIIPVWLNSLGKEKPENVNVVEITSFTELLERLQLGGDIQ